MKINFRVFDGEGRGLIDSREVRDILVKSLDQVSLNDIKEILDHSGLLQDRTITYKGAHTFTFLSLGMVY